MNAFCPYKGLMPYEEEDAPFFFGRGREQQLISSNFLASRLTLFYGPSAVGKSSVLYAGVVPQLHRMMVHNLKEFGHAELLAVNCRHWRDDPEETLRHNVAEALTRLLGEPVDFTEMSLTDCLRQAASQVDGDVLLLLDQFEEYFQYHAPEGELDAFAHVLADIISDRSLPVNVLISIREDSLAKLDAFKGHIPNLFDNYLRLDFLDLEGARNAIVNPVAEYNRRYQDQDNIDIEPALVDEILHQVSGGKQYGALTGQDNSIASSEVANKHVETPYLQLVLTRLWDAEISKDSKRLCLTTFVDELGGAKQIVSSHRDRIFADLTLNEREIAAEIFRYLVTSSGTKFAQSVDDLADYTGYDQALISALANKLSATGKRILRPVAPPLHRPDLKRYEIFHDVLGAAVLEWSRQFRAKSADRAKRLAARQRLIKIALAFFVLIAISTWAYQNYFIMWKQTRPWAYITSLTSANSYALSGDETSVGRTVEGHYNTVDVRLRTVSRFHLKIYRNFIAIDARSRNGTTVNAQFLPYGATHKLTEGDIVALAGADVFRFHPYHYETLSMKVPVVTDHPQTQGWGVFIDGSQRKITYLSRSEYYLKKEQKGFSLQTTRGTDSLGVIRWDGEWMSIMDFNDDVPLIFTAKENDYDYRSYKLDSGKEYSYLKTNEDHDMYELAYEYDGRNFQIIPIHKDIERGEVVQ